MRLSFCLFCYNQQAFVAQAVRAALAQDYDDLEIIISDDASTDDTFAIISETVAGYSGPHKVILNRNTENLGIGFHVNKVASMATGALLVFAAGDDISLPQRCRLNAERFLAEDRPMLIHSNLLRMEPDGTLTDEIIERDSLIRDMTPREAALSKGLALGASCAWNAELFTRFPLFTHRDCYEDLSLTLRSMLIGKIVHLPEALVQYRSGGISDWRLKEDPQYRAKRRARRARVQIIVLQQHLTDIDHIAYQDKKIRKFIRHKISKFEMREASFLRQAGTEIA